MSFWKRKAARNRTIYINLGKVFQQTTVNIMEQSKQSGSKSNKSFMAEQRKNLDLKTKALEAKSQAASKSKLANKVKRKNSKAERANQEPDHVLGMAQPKPETTDYKIDTVALQNHLLKTWLPKIGIDVSREEYDLLRTALLSSNNVGFVKFYSHCEKTDFAIATYKTLHSKINRLYPTLKLDKKIRFFYDSNYPLRTQKQIEALVEKRYKAPTPLNEICNSKNLGVHWFQQNPNKAGVLMSRMAVVDSAAKTIGKSILNNAKKDSFSWTKNADGNLEGCYIEIKTLDELLHLLSDVVNATSKTTQARIKDMKAAMLAASKLEDSGGMTIFFKTKAPKKDRSERVEWVQPEPLHYTRTGLKARKWSDRLIDKYLAEPDAYFNNPRNPFMPTHGYEIARVKKIEKSSAFIDEFQLGRKTPVSLPGD